MTRIALKNTTILAALLVGSLAVSGAEARHKEKMGTVIAGGRLASATLMTPDGKTVGSATVLEVSGGLRLTARIDGLSEGMHGAHVHTVGKCDAPDFASAGGHWNPGMSKHGSMNPSGPHTGDLPNLVVGKNNKGALGINLPGATFDGLMDADGSALVIHAGADDLVTDPSGNSGGRIACGVFVAK